MVTSLRGVPLVLLFWLIACSAGSNPPAAPETANSSRAMAEPETWGCYDLKPGHPTAAEQEAFIDELARLATRAEERYGVPAAALVAIAIVESGFGWTRLALNTNNLFAWKHFPGPATEGRQYWVLECQPDEPGTRFVVFDDRAEAVDFVARQLATSDSYRTDTERYRRDRAAADIRAPLARLGLDQAAVGGADVVEAVNRWVQGVANPYSSNPAKWSRDVRRILSDPYEPSSDRLSPERNLYRLSGLAQLSPDAPPAPSS